MSDDEKQEYVGRMMETGSYQGYKLRQYWVSVVYPVSRLYIAEKRPLST